MCDATACYCLQALSLVSKDMDLLEACMPTLFGTSCKAGLLQLLPYHYNVYNAQIVHHCVSHVLARYCEKIGG